MRALKGVLPIAVSVGLVLATTAVLWRINSTAAGSYHLVYLYLFPVALIATLYNGRLALLGTAVALIWPITSCKSRCTFSAMTILSNTATFLFSPFWLSQRSGSSEYWCGPARH
jgi:hypothetical protein